MQADIQRAILSNSGNVVTFMCMCGRKTLQTYGSPIQTYGKHSRCHKFLRCESKFFQVKLLVFLFILCARTQIMASSAFQSPKITNRILI